MKQYLMSVHYVEGQEPPAPDKMAAMYADVAAYNAQLQADGLWVFGGGLHEPSTATVVRSENGEVLTTDGPFAEAKEQIGGFWVIKAEDLDAALALAAKASTACQGPVEVRSFQEEPAA
ncbi:MAG: YciI family protein [Actinomycetota bacterium]|nr:YciI family protein [Actinomycetota bacterium]MDQ2956435.1 YciI family protein [Actinomycetota bacterium]